MIVPATRSIAITTSTDTLRLTQPCESGDVTCTSATSGGMRPLAINSGICTSEIGRTRRSPAARVRKCKRVRRGAWFEVEERR
jgi:ribosomal protein S12